MQLEWLDVNHKRYVGMHGITASIGSRSAEVVQAYEGQWCAFLRIDGQMCKRMSNEPEYLSYQSAKKLATQFLKGEITPEVWPPK